MKKKTNKQGILRLGAAPFQNANGKEKRRKRLEKLFNQNNRCFYCDIETVLPEKNNNTQIYHPNMATIEHLFCKYDIRRPLTTFASHTVLACFKCNKDRGFKVDAELHPSRKQYKGLLVSLLNSTPNAAVSDTTDDE